MRTNLRVITGVLAAGLLMAAPAHAQFNSGSTGALGALNVTTNTTLTTPPDGVFHYTTITINAGVTLKFMRNAANTPITLLATGNVTINGIIDIAGTLAGGALNGATALFSNGGIGGPGGFDGGGGATGIASTTGGNGLGPGGGGGGAPTGGGGGGGGFLAAGANATGAGTPGAGGAAYGSPNLLPLIGGSGGGGGASPLGHTGPGGGGGGGAIVIASSGAITLGQGGRIFANGGNSGQAAFTFMGGGGAGAGGAIRLIASTVTGNGQINVNGGVGVNSGVGGVGGNGSTGRLRIEAFANTAAYTLNGAPPSAVSVSPPTTVALTNAPTLRIASVGGIATPASPAAAFGTPDVTLPAATTNPVAVGITAANIPLGTVITVSVSGQMGGGASSASTGLSGTLASSSATANVTIPTTQPSILSATATFLVADLGGGPVYADGELVERVRVSATATGVSRMSYITRAGRETAVR
jgi:hypothetical protein